MSERRDHWERIYGAKAEDQVSWFERQPGRSLDLIRRAVPASAAVIDVGGGASRLVDELMAVGYRDLTVLDLAEAALARSRQRLGTRADAVAWIAADVTAWAPPRCYDLWHDRAVFHFLTEPAERAAYCAALGAALRAGGSAVIATFAPSGPERCSGLPVVRYSPESLAAELGNGLVLEETAAETHRTPSGVEQDFQFSRFRRT